MENLNWVDYLILVIIGLSAVIGFARGLIREVLSLGIWIAAIFVAWLFFRDLAAELEPWISTPSVRQVTAFVLIVFGMLLIGALLGFVLTTLIDKTGLSGFDRLMGLIFGVARGGVLVALLVFIVALTPMTEDPWWNESQLIAPFERLADYLLALVPPDIEDRIKVL
ncbi:CvpA family protein [Thioalkalicoccus limnaeus]|uniref:CvpA family protein n=1 Tax=Thioalkalicoccus limnaeus TaxID=120681 RepID=A0ABV4BH71_9GAMM